LAQDSLASIHSSETTISPVRLVIKLLTRMVQLVRNNVSYQDAVQLIAIEETDGNGVSAKGSFDTIAIRCSLMLVRGANNVDLEIQKHSWTACFNCFQNEARVQLEALGYRTAFFSFSILPQGKRSELASDLYLCVRIGKRNDSIEVGQDKIYSRVSIDANGIRGFSTDIGFAL
jgi:hypothetical protein